MTLERGAGESLSDGLTTVDAVLRANASEILKGTCCLSIDWVRGAQKKKADRSCGRLFFFCVSTQRAPVQEIMLLNDTPHLG